MKSTYGKLLMLGFLSIFVCCGYYIFLAPSLARGSLPASATEIHEHYTDARLGADYTRCLKAKVDEAGFELFANRLGLDQVSDSTNTLIKGIADCDEPWWNPPQEYVGARFEKADHHFAIAVYHDGYVYFSVRGW